MEVRKFERGDEGQIKWLHYHTVRAINGKDYTEEQINAWSPENRDSQDWTKLLEKRITYVALIDGNIVGFGDINDKGYMQHLYTHKDYQGRGIGSAILEKLEEEAKNLGLEEISLDSSITAKTFYEKKGYNCLCAKTIELKKNVPHEVFSMKKRLLKVHNY